MSVRARVAPAQSVLSLGEDPSGPVGLYRDRVRSTRLLLPLLVVGLAACGGSAADIADSDDPYDSAWCVSARESQEASDAIDAVDPNDPEAVKEAVTEMLAEAEGAAPLAPPDIAADVAESLETFRQLDAALASVEYDLVRADLTGIADDLSATERVDAYNAEVCGVDFGPEPTTSPSMDLSSGSVRDQIVAGLVQQGFTEDEAECVLDSIDPAEAATMTEEEILAGVIVSCGIDVESSSGDR